MDKIIARIVNRADNAEMLKEVPFTPVANNLAVIYRHLLYMDKESMASMLITNKSMCEMELDKKELHRLAMENTKRLFPIKCETMENMLQEMIPEGGIEAFPEVGDIKLYVLSNEIRMNGAVCITDTDFMQQVSEQYFEGQNFKILPSSIHEVLAVSEDMDTNELLQLVCDANNYVLDPGERLADAVYQYDADKKLVSCIASNVPLRSPQIAR
ncbi:MAG: DUF5688 family protein [Bacteroides sp.]|nr:DUF5688 family protein [Bacteroides sp.]MCM1550960.1 DUF5688 family protein [Clostridium sp.]